jgi:hypothetical protein
LPASWTAATWVDDGGDEQITTWTESIMAASGLHGFAETESRRLGGDAA